MSSRLFLPLWAALILVSISTANAFAYGSDGWYTALRFGYFPYTAEVEGTAAGRDFDTEADLSDLLDNTETLLGGEFEVGKGKYFLSFTGFFQEVETDRGSGANKATITSSETALNPMLGYRVYQEGLNSIDVMAGLYYVKLDLDVDINSTALGDIDVERDLNFTDPMIGIRGYYGFNKKFGIGAGGQIGGFGVGSEIHFQVSTQLIYHIDEMFSLAGGYKVWYWEYEDDDAPVSKFDQNLHGPFIGLQVLFK